MCELLLKQRFSIVVILLAFAPLTVYSQDARIKSAEARYFDSQKESIYSHNWEGFKKEAKKGDLFYQLKLGDWYLNDDPVESLKWYKMAADQGSPIAQQIVGSMYYVGKGTEVNYTEAYNWYKKSAEKSNAEALYMLGYMYAEGKGVDVNKEEAFNYYLKSAKQGHSTAQNNLAYAFEYGIGTEKNKDSAFYWYNMSAAAENRYGIENLARCFFYGDLIERNGKIALGYAMKVSQYPLNQMLIGDIYYCGIDVPVDYKLALNWYLKAYGKVSKIDGKIGRIYYKGGNGVTSDYQKAISYFEKGIKDDCPMSLNHMGLCCLYGKGCEADSQKALQLFEKAITLAPNAAEPYANIGIMYYEGMGVTRDYDKAVEWLKKSVEVNPDYPSAEGMRYLAKCYRFGRGGLQKDILKADELDKNAATINNDLYESLSFYREKVNNL